MNILIAEDSATITHAMRRYIENAGHTSVVARNGEEALQMFDPHTIDMVIMDVQMPGLDGFETTRLMRELLAKDDLWLPIIFVTGKSEEENLQKGIEVGGDDYLIKPVSETILAAKIRAMERIIVMRDELQRLNQNLVELSEHDSLTKLYNRRTFDERAQNAWKQAARNNEALAILIMDIDHFKLYNDYYGHMAGDECITRVAEAIQGSLSRPGDILARFGGEEFIVLLSDTSQDGAFHVAERIRARIAALNIRHRESPTANHITISIGGAVINHTAGTELKDQINAADKALYAAKQSGRNRVLVKLFSPKVRILVGDAQNQLATAIEGQLKQYFALLQVRSGQELLDMAIRNRPDVILIADDIPGWGVDVVAKALRSDTNTAHIPLLVTTTTTPGDSEFVDAYVDIRSGADPLIIKLNNMLF
jgi:diguanylate cyclase (GGDEF)-like protein